MDISIPDPIISVDVDLEWSDVGEYGTTTATATVYVGGTDVGSVIEVAEDSYDDRLKDRIRQKALDAIADALGPLIKAKLDES